MSGRGARVRAAALIAVLIVITAACGSSSKSNAGNGSTTTKVASDITANQLNGKKFQSTTVTGHNLVAGTHITLTFESGQLGAQAGCNTMSAPYEISSGTLRWTSDPRSTLIACPSATSAQDQWLSSFLTTGAAATLAGEQLTLVGSGATITLTQQK